METVLLGLAALSAALCVWQWQAGRRFPVGRRVADPKGVPLSILKPLKGADRETAACLRSWFEQEHPEEVELLFGVADERDPVCAIVRELAPQYPNRPSKLVICAPVLGSNGKVSSLYYLLREAKYEHVVIGDADVEIPKDFLAQVSDPLSRGAALVNCFYILRPLNLAMAVEAVGINADFWSQVLQGNSIQRMHFALGAAIATTKTELARIGGFEGMLDYLADDYQLGNRIARAGGRLEICPVPVTCWSAEQSWGTVWKHQLRWARTIRVCRPVSWFWSILGNGTLWPVLAWLAYPSPRTLVAAQIGLLVRALTAKANYQRLTGGNGWIAFGLAPVKDAIHTVVWALSFAGGGVTWSGRALRVNRRGKLTPLA